VRRESVLCAVLCLWAALAVAADRHPVETPKHGPQPSGFFDFFQLQPSEVQSGVGNIGKFNCMVGAGTQPAEYAGNSLLDCDGEVPHNETTIAVNPGDPDHAVGAYHSYVVQFKGATAVTHVVSAPSVTTDGGDTWHEVLPPITPYQFSGDPAVAFNTRGQVFLASIADHEGPGGPYSSPSVIVQRSLDGGHSWSRPVTLARGEQAATPNRFGLGPQVFNDKEFITADTTGSDWNDRLYVTWSRFTQFFTGTRAFFKIPIQVARSDDGANWSSPRTISGSSPSCVAHIPGLPFEPDECDLNQNSYPTVAPGGRVYVSFENFNTEAENQILVVRSDDGGETWSAPSKATDVFDINFPQNTDKRDTLTGCQLRYSAVANSAADPSDPTGNTVYVALADNRDGGPTPDDPTDTDVFLAKSTDGGAHWSLITVDDSPNDQFYPWVAVGADGTVNVGYMDRSYGNPADPGDQTICKYGFSLTRLTAAGAVIGKVRVDTGLSHADESRWFSSATDPNTRFIGDYNGVAVDSVGAAWSLWTDHRTEIPDLPTTLVDQKRTHGQHAVGTLTP
jgi:hypothetical protein